MKGTAKVVVRLTRHEQRKALPILLHHSPGMILRGGIYIISAAAARALQSAGVRFTLICSEGEPLAEKEIAAGRRI